MQDLYDVIEELVHALEKRETVEPDVAAWEAEEEIRMLERRLLDQFRPGLLPSVAGPAASLASMGRPAVPRAVAQGPVMLAEQRSARLVS